jgi:hypothetical protein
VIEGAQAATDKQQAEISAAASYGTAGEEGVAAETEAGAAGEGDVSMEEVLGDGGRKQPATAEENADVHAESQTF